MSFDPFQKAAVSSHLQNRVDQAPVMRSFTAPQATQVEQEVLADYRPEVTARPTASARERAQEETEEQRQAQRDKKENKAKQEAIAKVLRVHDGSQNKLLSHHSHFLCSFKFMNTLPDPPVEPKLLRQQVDMAQQGEYGRGTLDSTRRRQVFLDRSMGLKLNLLDPEEFFVGKRGRKLHPDDAALIADVAKLTKKKGGARGNKRLKPSNVPWLMHKPLMDANMEGEELYTAKAKRAGEDIDLNEEEDDLEARLNVVQAELNLQFDQANNPRTVFTHPTRPALKMKCSKPVLPNVELLPWALTHVTADRGLPGKSEVAPRANRESILLTQSIIDERNRQSNVISTLVPEGLARELKGEDAEDDLEAMFASDDEDQGDGKEAGEKFRALRTLSFHFGSALPNQIVVVEDKSDDRGQVLVCNPKRRLNMFKGQNEARDTVDQNVWPVKKLKIEGKFEQKIDTIREHVLYGGAQGEEEEEEMEEEEQVAYDGEEEEEEEEVEEEGMDFFK